MKILIAEDNKVQQKILTQSLEEWGFEYDTVSNGKDALDRIIRSSNPPDLVLMDWLMPKMDGVDVCRIIRKLPERSFSYIILLSGKDATKDVVEGLDAGADDYLAKPYHPDELLSRIRAGERIIKLQHKLAEANEKLTQLANTDSLTQLMNRPAIVEQLEKEVTRAKRGNSPMAVVMADVDHFKSVNDTHGHTAGDAVLKEFADRVGGFVRKYDSLGRYGGEEFMILLPGLPSDASANVVERFREKIADTPFRVDGEDIQVSASFGVAWFTSDALPDALQAVKEADALLYAAKNNGRNRVETRQFIDAPVETVPAR